MARLSWYLAANGWIAFPSLRNVVRGVDAWRIGALRCYRSVGLVGLVVVGRSRGQLGCHSYPSYRRGFVRGRLGSDSSRRRDRRRSLARGRPLGASREGFGLRA